MDAEYWQQRRPREEAAERWYDQRQVAAELDAIAEEMDQRGAWEAHADLVEQGESDDRGIQRTLAEFSARVRAVAVALKE